MLYLGLMTQRSRAEIISLILQSAEKGATKTILMYETYLSHDALKEHLSLLLENCLLEYLTGEMQFKTTAKGLQYLSRQAEEAKECCSHQCKKCGVLYSCGYSKCNDSFHHGPCQQCLKMFSYQSYPIVSR